MGDLSLVEKLKIFVDVSSSSGICIASIFILVFMAFMFLTTSRKNAKSTRLLFIGIYTILILVLCLQYSSSLPKMFDYMMNNFFIVFYFPNLAIYLAAIITTNIILFVSIFNFKEDKLLKIINTIVYSFIHYLLILILNIVTKNKLDVFSQTSVYGNEKASAMISLTSIIFIVWVVFIIIYKIIRKTQKAKNLGNEEVVTKYVEVPVKRVNPNIVNVDFPKLIAGTVSQKKEPQVVPMEYYNKKLEIKNRELELKNRELEIRNKEIESNKYGNMFTLEEYKTVLNILKGNKENVKNEVIDNNVISAKEDVIINKFPTKLDELLNI